MRLTRHNNRRSCRQSLDAIIAAWKSAIPHVDKQEDQEKQCSTTLCPFAFHRPNLILMKVQLQVDHW